MKNNQKKEENFFSRSGLIMKIAFAGIGVSTLYTVYKSLELAKSRIPHNVPKFVQTIISKSSFERFFGYEGGQMLLKGLSVTSTICSVLMIANVAYSLVNSYTKSKDSVPNDKKQTEQKLVQEKSKDLNLPKLAVNIAINSAALIGVAAVVTALILTSGVAAPIGFSSLFSTNGLIAAKALTAAVNFRGTLFTPISIVSSVLTTGKIIKDGISVVRQIIDKILPEKSELKLEILEKPQEINQNKEKGKDPEILSPKLNDLSQKAEIIVIPTSPSFANILSNEKNMGKETSLTTQIGNIVTEEATSPRSSDPTPKATPKSEHSVSPN